MKEYNNPSILPLEYIMGYGWRLEDIFFLS
jgi:hypothetical protein